MHGGMDRADRLRIGIVAPPLVRIPPKGYAGTERIVAALALGLHERGHEVTVFASGDSDLPCEVVPVVPQSVWSRGGTNDGTAWFEMSVALAWEQAGRFDVMSSHVEQAGFLMARHCGTPVVTTMHRRIDTGGVAQLIDRMPDVPLIAISDSQRRWNPDANWVATIHHGLDFTHTPVSATGGDYLLLIGRISAEKGVAEAIQVARRSGHRLVMAAKVQLRSEREMFESIVRPAIEDGVVDWRGEVEQEERDRLMAGAHATLMLGAWPEPFGLVAIESMATGTPVIARRAGGVTETIEHGSTGFLVDDVDEAVLAVERIPTLRRDRVAAYARGRFSADRMTTLYEQAFTKVLAVPMARGREIAVAPGLTERPSAILRNGMAVDVAPVADLVRARRNRSERGSHRPATLATTAAGQRPAG